MYLRQVTPPAVEPVTLEETKLHLRVDGTEEDNLISALIKAARQKAEEYTRRAFITQTWEVALDAVISTFLLPRPPVQTIETITVDGKTVAPEIYGLAVNLFYTKNPLYAVYPGGLVIRYVSGYGSTAEDIPQAIRQAILMLVAHLYEHRGDVAEEIPPMIKSLLQPFRVMLL